jgi:3-hydroxyisobutyrate dehydrogenase-like beta-hydroxyacid dehydrogenase
MSVVGFIGLGRMGSRMARRLLDAGHDLVVWNRTPERMAPLVEAGALPAKTPADAARRSEAVLTMVSDPAALFEMTEGPDGLAAGVGPSATVIEMSTVGPDAIRRLASRLPPGTGLLDAPVLGSLAEAEAGTLRIFVGGSQRLLERWTPLLSDLGSPLHVGELGWGAGAKLVANLTLLGVLGLLGEALSLARGLGLAHETAFEVLAATPLAAQAERRRPSIESGEYPARFSLSLALKDADLILDAAGSAGADLRLVKAARTWLADANEGGWTDRDYAAVLAWILEEHDKASSEERVEGR